MPYDVWVRALLAVPTFAQHEPRFQLAHEALGDPAARTRFNHVREQGQTLIKARIKYAYASMEVLLDPAANYLVRRIHVKPVSENLSVTTEVTGFLEPVPGLFFPSGCVTRIGDAEEIRYTFSAVRINSPIADDRFKLVLPAETVTSDYLQGTVYRTDSDGNNLGPVRTPSGQPATLGAGTFGPTNGLETVDVSVTRVTSWRPYVVLLAALTLASAAWLVFRGYRHRSSAALEKQPYGHLKSN